MARGLRTYGAAFVIATMALLAPSRASAETYEMREQVTDFVMTLGDPSARVCVAFPVEKRTESCADLDFTSFGAGHGDNIVVLFTPEWELTVALAGDTTMREGEWTAGELREAEEYFKKVEPFATPFEKLSINGVQAFHKRAASGGTRSRIYVFVGDDGQSLVRFTYRVSVESKVAALIDTTIGTARARPADPLWRRVVYPVGSLLAGAPLVLIAAAFASRKRQE